MPAESDLYRDFVPRRGRPVAYGLAVVQFVLLAAIGLLVPGGEGGFGIADRLLMVATGALIAFILWRLGRVRAEVDQEGLVVRNLIYTTRRAWPEIVSVQFGGGAPWVVLDLADGDNLTVMAIQRSDGEFAEREATRMATLVALGSRTN